MITFEFRSVSKSFEKKPVLNGVSLNVSSGATSILLGSSGSGKSTLLKIALGLLSQDAGDLILCGAKLEIKDRSRWIHRFGFVPQDAGLFPHLTAAQNVTLVATTLQWSKDKISARLDDVVDLVSLDKNLLSQYPRHLSGGERQRVALMRAVFLDPDVLFLDEPLSALDPIVRAQIQSRLREVFRRLNKAVLCVTHDISEAVFLGDRISLMKDGRILQTGRITDLADSPTDPYITEFISAQRSWDSSRPRLSTE